MTIDKALACDIKTANVFAGELRRVLVKKTAAKPETMNALWKWTNRLSPDSRRNAATYFKHRSIRAGVLLIHLLQLIQLIATFSPTVDEVSHLPAGLSHWRFGRFDIYRVNPPLVDTAAAVPLLFTDLKEDWSQYSLHKNARWEFAVGARFVVLNGENSIRLYRYGRLACVPFSLIGAVSVYWFARHLYGRASGIVAMGLWCFSPNVLGNAAIITPDVAGGAFAILAALAFWKWLDSPNWGRTVAAGLALGLAELAKTTCVILYVLWPLIWIIWRCTTKVTEHTKDPSSGLSATFSPCQGRKDDANLKKAVAQLVTILVLGVYVTNLGYLFDGSFQQLKDYQFVSQALGGATASHAEPNNRFRDSILGYIPVPFPVDYIHGIDLQKLDFEGERWSYAGGVQQKRGWWWWYLYAMAVKVPHGTMVIVVMAAVASWMGRGNRTSMIEASSIEASSSEGGESPDGSREVAEVQNENKDENNIRGLTSPARRTADWLLLIPAVCILVLVSSQTGFSRYFHYLLPAFPFVFVWASRVAQPHLLKNRWWKGLVAFALLWNVWSCLRVHPHHLAFFNEASGGSDNGHWHLLDANVDWGQANLALKHWQDEREQQVGHREDFYLSCFGVDYGMKLEDLGLHGKPIPMKLNPETKMNQSLPISELPPGLYAISVNHLHGYRHHKTGDPDCSEFLKLKPIAIVGSAIQVFELPVRTANPLSLVSATRDATSSQRPTVFGQLKVTNANPLNSRESTWHLTSYRPPNAGRSPIEPASNPVASGGYEVRTRVALDGQTSRYLVFMPNTGKPPAGYPVIMFLNGFGENGNDGIRQVNNNFGVDVYRYRQTFQFIAVCPQCSPNETWRADGPDALNALAILKEVLEQCGGDPDRVYLTGVSAGGAGVWQLASARPELFAALWPVSSGCPADLTDVINQNIPVWSHYNASDRRDLVDSARKAHQSLLQGGLSPIVTEYDRSGHDAWTEAYRSTVVYDWLLEQSRTRNLESGKFRQWSLDEIRKEWTPVTASKSPSELAADIGLGKKWNEEFTYISRQQAGDCELHAEFQLKDGATCDVAMLDSAGRFEASVSIELPSTGTGRFARVDESAKALDPVAQRSIRPGWNDLRIAKNGDQVRMQINGLTAAEFAVSSSLKNCRWAIQIPDDDESVRWRNIRTRDVQDHSGDLH